MRTLVFGAGPLGCLYSHRLARAGKDVTLLARGPWHDRIREEGLALVDEITGEHETSRPRVVDALEPDDAYDLAVVLIRKNKLFPVLQVLAGNANIGNILFMGNNALGLDAYLDALPREKLLFGFPGAGGGVRKNIVHYADRETPGGKRRAITLGEIDGNTKDRTRTIVSLFESSGVPVDLTKDIDGWLRYHVALISPLANALYRHNCDNYSLAADTATLRTMVRAAKEGGNVLKALGYKRRQPFAFNLFYWLPELLSIKALRDLLNSKFAEVAFSMHARSGRDEMRELAKEFRSLIEETNIETPNFDLLASG